MVRQVAPATWTAAGAPQGSKREPHSRFEPARPGLSLSPNRIQLSKPPPAALFISGGESRVERPLLVRQNRLERFDATRIMRVPY